MTLVGLDLGKQREKGRSTGNPLTSLTGVAFGLSKKCFLELGTQIKRCIEEEKL